MKSGMAVLVRAAREFIERNHRSQIAFAAFGCLLLALSAGCGGGGSSIHPPPTEAAPSNLQYPQTSIAATIRQAITPDVPTVSGIVTSYTVAPALPAGLSLNTSTGAISGTPTATAATATYTVTAANSVGSTTAGVQITVNDGPPENLVYPQTTITAVVGQAIASDSPTVAGTVDAYTVDPPLPQGLKLENTLGAIYGTPTSITPTATYVVTATNSFGSTTASVQITVNAAAPANLIYPRIAIVATQGRTITPDIPTVESTAANYTIDPALPGGMNLDKLTGVISGTPVEEAPPRTYVITASNVTGTTTASVSISVARAMRTLLYLGHEYEIKTMRAQGSRLLSLDSHGFWTLWDFESGAVIADGDEARDLDMVDTTIVTAIANGLEIRSATDGHVLATIIVPGLISLDTPAPRVWWRLAADGSYVCAGSESGLFVWNLAGELMATRSGDYSNAQAFSAPGEVRLALGPAGVNVIETISAADGTSSVSEPFFGTFRAWFVDGGRFLSSLSQAVWVYSKDGVQQSVVELPIQNGIGGEGNWFWNGGSQFSIYSVGESTPTVTYSFDSPTVIPSGTRIGLVNYLGRAISIIDLSGPTPTKFDPSFPLGVSTYAAASASQWALGNSDGVLVDGTSLSGEPRYFGLGAATSIAGSSNRVVVSTASGTIFSFDPAATAPEVTIALPAGKVALSDDGSVLAASPRIGPDKALKVYSLPSASLISSLPLTYPDDATLTDFSLSASGGTLGQVTGGFLGMTWTYYRQVLPVAGGTPSWSELGEMNNTPIHISPDGTQVGVSKSELWGISVAPYSPVSTTRIIENGTLSSVVPGYAVGWLDNARLLVNTYVKSPCTEMCSGEFGYDHASIYGPDGVALATPAIPEILHFQSVTPDLLYSVTGNFIVSLSTGEILWKSPYPSQGIGGVGEGFVVFDAERHVYVEAY